MDALSLPGIERAELARTLLDSLSEAENEELRYRDAVELFRQNGSISLLRIQVRFKLGHSAAVLLAERLQQNGIPVRLT